MIAVRRPKQVPAVLRQQGMAKRRQHEKELGADPRAFAEGRQTLAFDRSIYADVTVKTALIKAQHAKCAFCEAKPLHVSDGDVEHFRPKAATRQADDEPLERPGYYWLAYAWQNLLFACESCNRRHKQNSFPLIDPKKRAKQPSELPHETPVFIDPAAEDPLTHIMFREHVPVARNGSARGEQTIDALGLRRPRLNRDREDHLERLWAIFTLANLPGVAKADQKKALVLLAKMTTLKAEYALMSITAVNKWAVDAASARRPARSKGLGV